MTEISPEDSGVGTKPAPLPPRSREIRVLLVDDYEIYRRGLRMILDLEDDIVVAGECGTAAAALEQAQLIAPDVVVLDIYLPDGNGLTVCRRLSEQLPETQVLMLTASDDETDLVEAVKAGAIGYLLKDIAPGQLPDAIRSAAAGHAQLSPALASTLLSEFSSLVRGAPSRDMDALGELSDRERQVLALVAQGLSNRKIAGELFIAENTVKNHVRSILDKLQLRSRTEAAMYAVRGGLVDDPAHHAG